MNKFKEIGRADAIEIMNKWYNIPKYLCVAIIKEMEMLRMIEVPNRQTIKLLTNPEIRKIENAQQLYAEFGIF